MNCEHHTFIIRTDDATYRASSVVGDELFESYMTEMDYKLPYNMRVAHSGTASQAILDKFPVINFNPAEFIVQRIGMTLLSGKTPPTRVVRMSQDIIVTETNCGYGRCIRLNPKADRLIFNELYPISFREAKAFVNEHHRHCAAPQGHKFSIGLLESGVLVGVIIASIPKARHLNDGFTLELNRCCVLDSKENACSKLYSRAIRAGRALGYRRFVTYTLTSEPGSSLKAVGFCFKGYTKPSHNGWDTPSRPRSVAGHYPLGCKCRWILEM